MSIPYAFIGCLRTPFVPQSWPMALQSQLMLRVTSCDDSTRHLMIICPPKLRRDGDQAILTAEVRFGSGVASVWYSVDKRYEPYLVTERLDGFLVGLLPLAMSCGEEVQLQAPISEKLYFDFVKINLAFLPQIL